MAAPFPAIADDQLGELAHLVRAPLCGQSAPQHLRTILEQRTQPLCAEARCRGRLVAIAWHAASNQWESLCRLLQDLPSRLRNADELLLCFFHSPRFIAIGDAPGWRRATANILRGLVGYQLTATGDPAGPALVSPFELVAQNRTFEKMLASISAQWSISFDQAKSGGIQVIEFDTEQFWIDLSDVNRAAVRLFRGSRLVPQSEITTQAVEELARLLGDYLVRSVQPDGRMVYLYYPSRGTEDSTRDNSIRQWMATRTLNCVWERTKDAGLLELLQKNVTHNLRTMYREDEGLGLICEGEKVKLGAIALAALALHESPFFDQFADVFRRLVATVTYLWQDNGEFRTFYRPPGRIGCQNFYPGETLLLWSKIIGSSADVSLLERFSRSFEHYQSWHLAHRNPAFIPWHTQAYVNLWRHTGDERLTRAVFAMNDWLLPIQQWETAPAADCQGRFYDPARPFGPPHASSTAVYLEGLADAFVLAKELGERTRADRYRLAILRGLRSLRQLTYKDDTDMFYITKRQQVRGGVRTTEYNNAIRIDNVQHSLMAVNKVASTFSAADYC